MSDPFIGEIRMFAGNFAPAGWAFCSGQFLPISQNDALFALLGTTYGGDGQSTFALPDLRGRVPVHQGSGFTPGQAGGEEQVTLTVNQIAGHGHPLMGTMSLSNDSSPKNNVLAQSNTFDPYQTTAGSIAMAPQSISSVGGSQPHTNLQPYLCINFIIALEGIFPSQN
jgi:microcystin-dependent protein